MLRGEINSRYHPVFLAFNKAKLMESTYDSQSISKINRPCLVSYATIQQAAHG